MPQIAKKAPGGVTNKLYWAEMVPVFLPTIPETISIIGTAIKTAILMIKEF